MKTLALFIALFSALSLSGATLTWEDNSDNETGFEIERASEVGNFVKIGSVTSNVKTYRDATAVPGFSYKYRVRAFNREGFSAYSNTFDWVEPLPDPAPVLLPAEKFTMASISVGAATWSAVFTWVDTNTAETGYRLEYRKEGQKDAAWATAALLGANSVRATTPGFSDMASGYEWRLLATAPGVTGPPSAVVTTAAAATFLPTAPATLKVTK